MDRRRSDAPFHERRGARFVHRRMRAALERRHVKADLLQHALHGVDVERLAAVRSGGDGELRVVEAEAVGRTAFDDRGADQRFRRGAQERRAIDVACRFDDRAGRLRDGVPDRVLALDDAAARHDDGGALRNRDGFEMFLAWCGAAHEASNFPDAAASAL